MATHEEIEGLQAAQQVWFNCSVNAVPHPDETALFDLDVEFLTAHHAEQLRCRREPAALL
jgi:hypothetical protein